MGPRGLPSHSDAGRGAQTTTAPPRAPPAAAAPQPDRDEQRRATARQRADALRAAGMRRGGYLGSVNDRFIFEDDDEDDDDEGMDEHDVLWAAFAAQGKMQTRSMVCMPGRSQQSHLSTVLSIPVKCASYLYVCSIGCCLVHSLVHNLLDIAPPGDALKPGCGMLQSHIWPSAARVATPPPFLAPSCAERLALAAEEHARTQAEAAEQQRAAAVGTAPTLPTGTCTALALPDPARDPNALELGTIRLPVKAVRGLTIDQLKAKLSANGFYYSSTR